MKRKLSKLCYFRKVSNSQKKELLKEFKDATRKATKEEKRETFQQYKTKILTNFEPDRFKAYMMALHWITIAILAILPVTFNFSEGLIFGLLVYACYGLFLLLGISAIFGLFSRRIKIFEYKSHILVFLLQILLAAADVFYILVEFAKALEGF